MSNALLIFALKNHRSAIDNFPVCVLRTCQEGVDDIKQLSGDDCGDWVFLETTKVLLANKNDGITSHYSVPEIQELTDAANRICETDSRKTHVLVIF